MPARGGRVSALIAAALGLSVLAHGSVLASRQDLRLAETAAALAVAGVAASVRFGRVRANAARWAPTTKAWTALGGVAIGAHVAAAGAGARETVEAALLLAWCLALIGLPRPVVARALAAAGAAATCALTAALAAGAAPATAVALAQLTVGLAPFLLLADAAPALRAAAVPGIVLAAAASRRPELLAAGCFALAVPFALAPMTATARARAVLLAAFGAACAAPLLAGVLAETLPAPVAPFALPGGPGAFAAWRDAAASGSYFGRSREALATLAVATPSAAWAVGASGVGAFALRLGAPATVVLVGALATLFLGTAARALDGGREGGLALATCASVAAFGVTLLAGGPLAAPSSPLALASAAVVALAAGIAEVKAPSSDAF